MVTIPLAGRLLNSSALAISNVGINKTKNTKVVKQTVGRNFFTFVFIF